MAANRRSGSAGSSPFTSMPGHWRRRCGRTRRRCAGWHRSRPDRSRWPGCSAAAGRGGAAAPAAAPRRCDARPRRAPWRCDILRPPMFRNSYDDIQRRLALEHLARDRLRAVAGAALGAEILPVRLDGHAEQAPLRRPVHVEGQLGAAAEGRGVAGMAAAGGPGHQVGAALVVDPLPVPGGDDGGPHPAAVLADHRQRVPLLGMPDVGHAAVDVPHDSGPVERDADEAVHLAGGVDLAHPVHAVRPDAEALEGVQEQPGEVPRVRVVAVARGIRDMGQGRPIACSTASGVSRAWASIGSRSSTP